jgi:hypothetical protein
LVAKKLLRLMEDMGTTEMVWALLDPYIKKQFSYHYSRDKPKAVLPELKLSPAFLNAVKDVEKLDVVPNSEVRLHYLQWLLSGLYFPEEFEHYVQPLEEVIQRFHPFVYEDPNKFYKEHFLDPKGDIRNFCLICSGTFGSDIFSAENPKYRKRRES